MAGVAKPRRIEYVLLDDIERALDNPRDHEVEEIAASIERFGFTDAPVHDGRTGRIIAGHGRLEGLEWLRAHDRPVPEGIVHRRRVARASDGVFVDGWTVPVQYGWSSANDAEAEAMLITLNALTEAARWRTPGLTAMLQRVSQTPAGLVGTGYTQARLDELVKQLGSGPQFPASGASTYRPKSKPRRDPKLSEVTLLAGDCIEVMRAMPDNSVDAIVSDPPYGLEFMGKDWDSFRLDETAGNRHRGEHVGGQGSTEAEGKVATFGRVAIGGGARPRTSRCTGCGKRDQFRNDHECPNPEYSRWVDVLLDPYAAPPTMLAFQEWCRQWAEQAYRVLKPGGHMLAFGGTRTYHRLAAGVEDAGFEVRDSLHWIYGQGFPKSMDVSKAIDRELGAEREVVGHESNWAGPSESTPNAPNGDITAPATEQAEAWDGWGTALKPAHEPVVVARKPVEGTVARNVLEHGTGALNIDATRVPVDPDDPWAKGIEWTSRPSSVRPGTQGFITSQEDGEVRAEAAHEDGRWPPNILLAHAPECTPTDEWRTVKGSLIEKPATDMPDRAVSIGKGMNGDRGTRGHPDQRVQVYACAPGCPVAALDAESGDSKSPDTYERGAAVGAPDNVYAGGRIGQAQIGATAVNYGDQGGASRFFPVFRYEPKASTAERNAGLDHLPEHSPGEMTDREDGSAGLDSPRAGAGRTTGGRNNHPTVKPIELMRWLVRLVCPDGGTVLDPFAGSGTTLVAAVLEGCDAIGIEKADGTDGSDNYHPIIEGRIAWAKAQPHEEGS